MGAGFAWGDTPSTPGPIAQALDNRLTLLVARLCPTLPFRVGALTKVFAWEAGMAEMAGLGLHPAWLFNLVTLPTEFGGSALVILNRMTWLGAGALGVFTVFATFLGHRFWELSGAERATQLNSFLEHATISAAFILVTVIAVRDERRARP